MKVVETRPYECEELGGSKKHLLLAGRAGVAPKMRVELRRVQLAS